MEEMDKEKNKEINNENTQENNLEKLDNSKNKSSWGGKREGAGRPEGSKNQDTIEEREALRKFKARVRMRVGRLFNAQVSLAEGLQFMIRREPVRNKKGNIVKYEHTIVEDENEICMALDEGVVHGQGKDIDGNYYYISVKAPDLKAIDSMMDRTFGKAPQSLDLTSQGERIDGYVVEVIDKREDVDNDETEDSDQ